MTSFCPWDRNVFCNDVRRYKKFFVKLFVMSRGSITHLVGLQIGADCHGRKKKCLWAHDSKQKNVVMLAGNHIVCPPLISYEKCGSVGSAILNSLLSVEVQRHCPCTYHRSLQQRWYKVNTKRYSEEPKS